MRTGNMLFRRIFSGAISKSTESNLMDSISIVWNPVRSATQSTTAPACTLVARKIPQNCGILRVTPTAETLPFPIFDQIRRAFSRAMASSTVSVNRSTLYDADMPYMLRLTTDGVAIHASNVRAGAATHGCIGIPPEFAKLLFEQVRRGDLVAILPERKT